MERRNILKAAVWAVPAVAVAVGVPTASASAPSQTSDRIDFTNVTATVGPKKNTVYGNTKVKVLDGPAPVKALYVGVYVDNNHVVDKLFPIVNGWDNTGIINFEFEVPPGTAPVLVEFYSSAPGVADIYDTVIVNRPSWWNQ